MWGEWMDSDWYEEQRKRLNEQFEIEEKIDRIAHPLKYKLIDAKDKFAFWLLKL